MEYICENYSQDISLDELSEKFRISKTYINNLLKSFYHGSFLDVLQGYRLKEAKKMKRCRVSLHGMILSMPIRLRDLPI